MAAIFLHITQQSQRGPSSCTSTRQPESFEESPYRRHQRGHCTPCLLAAASPARNSADASRRPANPTDQKPGPGTRKLPPQLPRAHQLHGRRATRPASSPRQRHRPSISVGGLPRRVRSLLGELNRVHVLEQTLTTAKCYTRTTRTNKPSSVGRRSQTQLLHTT